MKLRATLVWLIVLPALLIAGCGGTGLQAAALGNTQAQLPFRLPSALIRQNRAAGTVLQMLHLVAEGAYPEVPAYYAPVTRCALGPMLLASVLDSVRLDLLGPTPQLLSDQSLSGGQLLVIKFGNPVAGRLSQTFFVRSYGGRWLIEYDTLIQSALPTFVYTQVSNEIAPGAAVAPTQALRASAAASNLYRKIVFDVVSLKPFQSPAAELDAVAGGTPKREPPTLCTPT